MSGPDEITGQLHHAIAELRKPKRICDLPHRMACRAATANYGWPREDVPDYGWPREDPGKCQVVYLPANWWRVAVAATC